MKRVTKILGVTVLFLVFVAASARAQGWSTSGDLGRARMEHTATLLNEGRVLVAGGCSFVVDLTGETSCTDSVPTAELYDTTTGTWTATGSMSAARSRHTATLLNDGRVLVTGPGATAELYDPATETWTSTGSMNFARHSWKTATLLNDGRVLVAGGTTGPPFMISATAELYDPATETWTATGSMSIGRMDHTATLLDDGRVLVAGGTTGPPFMISATAELYDPATETWTETGSMSVARRRHTATLLDDGRVLVAGGGFPPGTATAEIYDPSSGTWSPTGNMADPRTAHTATLLTNGRVLVAGGERRGEGTPQLNTSEEYDPDTGTWGSRRLMPVGRSYHTATLLEDGSVLVAGGADIAVCECCANGSSEYVGTPAGFACGLRATAAASVYR